MKIEVYPLAVTPILGRSVPVLAAVIEPTLTDRFVETWKRRLNDGCWPRVPYRRQHGLLLGAGALKGVRWEWTLDLGLRAPAL